MRFRNCTAAMTDTYLPWLFMGPIPQRMIVRAPIPRSTVTWKPQSIYPERVTVSSFDLEEGMVLTLFDATTGFEQKYTVAAKIEYSDGPDGPWWSLER